LSCCKQYFLAKEKIIAPNYKNNCRKNPISSASEANIKSVDLSGKKRRVD